MQKNFEDSKLLSLRTIELAINPKNPRTLKKYFQTNDIEVNLKPLSQISPVCKRCSKTFDILGVH